MNTLNPSRYASQSPFITGEPVVGDSFFDREDLLDTVYGFIAERSPYAMLVYGQRRIGKTSLLRKLTRESPAALGQDGIPVTAVYYNLQGETESPLATMLYQIAVQIALAAKIETPERDIFAAGQAKQAFQTFAQEIFRSLPEGGKLVILFDEFDSIGAREWLEDSPFVEAAYRTFIPFICEWLDGGDQRLPLKLIFATGRNYKDLEENRYGQLLKFATQCELGLFDEAHTASLLRQTEAYLPFEVEARETLVRMANGHPLFTQCLADAAFRLAEKAHSPVVSAEHVRQALPTALIGHGGAVNWIWHTLPDEAKVVLHILAALGASHTPVVQEAIQHYAVTYALAPVLDLLPKTLAMLCRNHFLYRSQQGGYQFVVPFIGEWIAQEISAEAAQSLIKIPAHDLEVIAANATYFHAHQNWPKVIELYQQLTESPVYQADAWLQLSLAQHHLGNEEAALDAYLHAFRYDPETAAATWRGQEVKWDMIVLRRIEEQIGGEQLPKKDDKHDITVSNGFEAKDGRIVWLNLSGISIENIATVAGLTSLKGLDISSTMVADLSPLRGTTALTYLDASGSKVYDLSPLATIVTLEKLYLNKTSIDSLFSLSFLLNLKELYVINTLISSIENLENLSKLEKLYIGGTNIKFASILDKFILLKELNISNTFIVDLDFLPKLININIVLARNLAVNNFPDLSKLKYLKWLDISNSKIIVIDFDKINNNLEWLNIRGMNIKNINWIRKLIKLKWLSFSYTQVKDLTPLESLTNLSLIDLGNTPVESLWPLRALIHKGISVKWNRTYWEGPGIYVQDCPLTNPPPEIVLKGNEAILQYWEDMGASKVDISGPVVDGERNGGKTNVVVVENPPKSPAKRVFLAYSHKDESLKEALDVHLATLKRSGEIEAWSDRKIMPGAEWDKHIKQELATADIILLLISADFIASDYIWEEEVSLAMQRHEGRAAMVVPIFLRSCYLEDTPFAKLQGLPKNARPITSFPDQDEAFFQVAKGIRAIIERSNHGLGLTESQMQGVRRNDNGLGLNIPRFDDLYQLLEAKLADQPGNHLLIMLSGRLHDVERQMALGILEPGDYQRERNRIRAALLQV